MEEVRIINNIIGILFILCPLMALRFFTGTRCSLPHGTKKPSSPT